MTAAPSTTTSWHCGSHKEGVRVVLVWMEAAKASLLGQQFSAKKLGNLLMTSPLTLASGAEGVKALAAR